MAAAQVQLAGGKVIGVPSDHGAALELEFQRIDNRAHDVILDGEDIVEFAVESFRPQLETVARASALRGHADTLAGAADAAVEH